MALTPNQSAAQARIHDLLTELQEIIGPTWDGDLDEGTPVRNAALGEWVIIMNWTDLDSGDGFLTRINSAHLQLAHRVGLLHEGLHGFDD